MEDDEDVEEEDEDDATYPDVDITLRITDSDGEPAKGVTVNLLCDHGILGQGFLGEEVTDTQGEVDYVVRSWQTYAVYLNHQEAGEISVEGGDDSFDFVLPE